jgi:lipopolysaccharide transport system ATP-binding protein
MSDFKQHSILPLNAQREMSMSQEVLISVEAIKKKFCRSLRKSLQYGLQDIASNLVGRPSTPKLRRGEFYAVDDISFELRRSECLGIIGKNGAGKTTILKMLNGLIKPDAGRIAVRGRVGALIALGAGFNPILSGRENIYVNGSILGMRKAQINEKLDSIIDFAELREFIDAPVQSYSSGMVVRLGFAIAVHSRPDSVLLDEVLAVGDAAFQAKCYNTLGEFRSNGIGFILVSHNLSTIDHFCDRVVYLKRGQIVYAGDPQTAIAAFNRDMLMEGDAAEGDSGPDVLGNGKVLLRRATFLDEMAKEITELRAGDPLTLRLEYECPTTEAVPSVVDIIIKDQSGTFFHHPSAVECGWLSGHGYIDVNFESIPANNQRLLFSIAIMGPDSRETYDWKRRLPLAVHGMPGYHGRVHLSYDWKVVRQDQEVAVAAK